MNPGGHWQQPQDDRTWRASATQGPAIPGPQTIPQRAPTSAANALLIIALIGLTIGPIATLAFFEAEMAAGAFLSLLFAHLGGVSLIAYFVVKALRQ